MMQNGPSGAGNAEKGAAVAKIAVIGAGAAGLAAARQLTDAGQQAIVFEARDRPGGRAWTDTSIAPHPVELGAEFIHGERVATWDWVREHGAPTTGAAHSYVTWYHLEGRLLDRELANEYFGTEPVLAMERLTRRWLELGRPEASLEDVLELWPEISGRPLRGEGRRLLANFLSEYVASDMDQVTTHRGSDLVVDEEPERLTNFRLLEGYTSLMRKAAAALPIRYETPVARLRWDDTGAEVESQRGSERFDRVVVALPLGVLKRGEVGFDPPLPPQKLEAIRGLNAGHISKVVLRLDDVYWPKDMSFLFTAGSTQLWWRPGQGQEHEAPVITAFFGGRDAEALEGATTVEAVAEAVRQLEEIVGKRLSDRVQASRYIAWGVEPYTWMGYSSVPPGGRGFRKALAEPVGALHFAGEATNLVHPATVHGAIETGRRAAGEVLRAL
jgi:monoamine oxidase